MKNLEENWIERLDFYEIAHKKINDYFVINHDKTSGDYVIVVDFYNDKIEVAHHEYVYIYLEMNFRLEESLKDINIDDLIGSNFPENYRIGLINELLN